MDRARGCEPSDWYLAEPLTERIAALRSHNGDSSRTTLQIARQAGAESVRAIEWREQFPFDDGPLFAQRLAASNITEGEFLCVMADETATLWGAHVPAWSRTVVDRYIRPQSPGSYVRGAPASGTTPWRLSFLL